MKTMTHPQEGQNGSSTCAVHGCGERKSAKGFCKKHHARFMRHGDPLVVKVKQSPAGAPQRFYRETVLPYAGDDCLIWPFSRYPTGYGRMEGDPRSGIVSRLVCEDTHGAPPTPKHQAAHTCGKGHEGCVTPSHLQWKTNTENMADTLVHGTRARGVRHGAAKLTEADALGVLALKGVKTQREIAEDFGVSEGAVAKIHAGERWGWLEGQGRRGR